MTSRIRVGVIGDARELLSLLPLRHHRGNTTSTVTAMRRLLTTSDPVIVRDVAQLHVMMGGDQ